MLARVGFFVSIAPSTPPQSPDPPSFCVNRANEYGKIASDRWPSPQIGVALFSKITCCSPVPSVKFGSTHFCRSAATAPPCRKLAKSLPVPDPVCVAYTTMFPEPGAPVLFPTESTFESFVPFACLAKLTRHPTLLVLGLPSPKKTVFSSAAEMFGVGFLPSELRVTFLLFFPSQ